MTTTRHHRTHLVTRDADMLVSLATAGWLTPAALEWLHWPTWAERWQTWASDQPYRPTSRLYARVAALHAQGLIVRVRRAIADGGQRVAREPDALALSGRGADWLAQHGRWDAASMWAVPRIRASGVQNVAHAVGIGLVYAALATRMAQRPGRQILHWQIDRQMATAPSGYDRVPVMQRTAQGGRTVVQMPVLPDATGVLQGERSAIRVFVEVDRGRPVETWTDKIAAYQAYQGSAALRERYGVTGFLLLCLTTTERQRQRLMEATARVVEQPSDRYLFGLLDEVHPTTIGDCWQKLGAVERTRSQVLAGRVVERYTVTPAPHVLIQ